MIADSMYIGGNAFGNGRWFWLPLLLLSKIRRQKWPTKQTSVFECASENEPQRFPVAICIWFVFTGERTSPAGWLRPALLPSFICVYAAPLNLVYYERAPAEQPCLSLFTFEYFASCITFNIVTRVFSVAVSYCTLNRYFHCMFF